MASSELSHILNNANANLYPNEQSLSTASFPTMHRSTSFNDTHYCNNNIHNTVGMWQQVNPQFWSRRNVLDWIDFYVEESKYDATLLNMDRCNMDGSVLCSLSRDAMMAVFGPQLGETLYHSLENLKHKHVDDITLNETYELLSNFLLDLPQSPFNDGPTLDSVIVQNVPPSNKDSDFSYYNEYKTQLTPGSDNGYESYSESLQSSITGSFLNPSSPESAGSDSDPENTETHYTYSPKRFIKQEPVEKKRRGRPPKLARGSELFVENKKNKHAPRGTHLWEFIRDILIHPEKNQGLMKWEDRRDGVFKFLKSEAVAQLWGQKKKNSSMTYEKLSRAMRYYYKREILERVDGRRLVYKFGKNSSGWKLEELGM
ncbi:ETS-related transcription factor Elf-3 [Tachysurus fulvidraco]|uniref:ETS-related transcription factor Elf-3 n=1 Tax=Tachysurus fulvidraco TaxID=1234273 RepID=UPI001FEE23D0|nr:ETS-related transcription factor Elf-3 [Tachysurus fulvidraco]